jgi:hypothetical protein
MTDILAQIGDKLGSKVKELEALINSGGGGGGNPTSPSDSCAKPFFTNGVLTSIITWPSFADAQLENPETKVSTKTFSYTNGNLTSVIEEDGSGVTTFTKTITYDSDGNLESITKDYA